MLQSFVIDLDFDELCQQAGSADLQAAVEIQPEEGLKCIEAAAHAVSFSLGKMLCFDNCAL